MLFKSNVFWDEAFCNTLSNCVRRLSKAILTSQLITWTELICNRKAGFSSENKGLFDKNIKKNTRWRRDVLRTVEIEQWLKISQKTINLLAFFIRNFNWSEILGTKVAYFHFAWKTICLIKYFRNSLTFIE